MAQAAKEPPKSPPPPSRLSWPMVLSLLTLMVGTWLWSASVGEDVPQVDYSVFFEWAAQGDVAKVQIKGRELRGELKSAHEVEGKSLTRFRTFVPQEDPALLATLREQGVGIRVEDEDQPFVVQLLLMMLPWLLILGAWLWISRRTQSLLAGGGPLGGMLRSKSRRFERKGKVEVTFDDVAGLGSAKRDLQEVVEFLREPERFKRLGGKIPRGILLVGPPGTGKTLLARAVAGESGVPFFSISGSEFIEMFVGVGAARVRDLFEEAKKSAPAIIFIDEIDAVGRSRGAGLGGGHDEREQTLNQLLSEMDGFDRNDLAIVLAATNRPDVLDPALLRPGRFDRRVMVDRPELPARRAILDVHAKGKPLGASVDLDAVARSTPGFSGADLANLVNEAALHATRRGADAIESVDFTEAYDKIVLGDPRETKLNEEEKHRIAVHEAGHAVVAQISEHVEPLHRVTIIPRGAALGFTQQMPEEDHYLMTEDQLRSRLRVFLGGYAAERVVYGVISSGAENDLKQASRIAAKMVAQYGMSQALGPIYFEHAIEHPFLGQRIATEGGTSDATTHLIEAETRAIVARAADEATQLLESHRDAHARLVAALLEHETLERDALQEILGARPERAARARHA